MSEPREISSPIPWCKAYEWLGCRIFVGIEAGKWHLSISHPTRLPLWAELSAARYRFVPEDVTVAMILPPKREFVNIHNRCFHLHEIEGEGWDVFNC